MTTGDFRGLDAITRENVNQRSEFPLQLLSCLAQRCGSMMSCRLQCLAHLAGFDLEDEEMTVT
ncbi:MAG: hypothetical protein V5B34_19050 [Accumulibacter sp.]|jgi:hypothetical protein|uniref:hypothetical protein n=1 Tax=Accumulibacter sp. TaxID=2053492 RepID=UPI002FC328E8